MAVMVHSECQSLQEVPGCVSKALAVCMWKWRLWGALLVVATAQVCATTPGEVSTGCCVTLNHWCVCEHVCTRTHACVYPSGTDCSGFPTVRRGGRRGKDGLLVPSRPEASSEVCTVCMLVRGAGRTGHLHEDSRKFLSPHTPSFGTVRKTIFRFFLLQTNASHALPL